MQKLRTLLTLKTITIMLGVLLALALLSTYYFYRQGHQDTQVEAQQELNQVITAVGKLIVLPTEEQPTLATVSDPEKLKDQSFFKNALKGDQVLIYTTARKAILYRPSANKIIEVAPVNAGGGL